MSICEYAQLYLGVDTLMHLSLTGMTVDSLRATLNEAKEAGIQNILALRGVSFFFRVNFPLFVP